VDECGHRYKAYTVALVDEYNGYGISYSNLALLEEPDISLLKRLANAGISRDVVLKAIMPRKVVNVRMLFKYCFEIVPLLVVRDKSGRIEVLEGKFDGFAIPSWGEDTVVYPKRYWLYSIPHPADIVAVDGAPYYRFHGERPNIYSEYREGFVLDDLMSGLNTIKNFVAKRFTGLITYSKMDPFTGKRYFYRYIPYEEPLMTLDVGIILPDDKWTRLDIQLDKNRHISEEKIVEICTRIIDDIGGLLIKSSSAGYHLVIPTQYAPVTVMKLTLDRVVVDDTTVVSENYFRMPYAFHWKTMEQAKLVYIL